MTDKGTLPEKYALLRQAAEERIQKWPSTAPSGTDCHQVIHELKIHLAEQEILNEELRRSMGAWKDKDEIRYESVRAMFWPLS